MNYLSWRVSVEKDVGTISILFDHHLGSIAVVNKAASYVWCFSVFVQIKRGIFWGRRWAIVFMLTKIDYRKSINLNNGDKSR